MSVERFFKGQDKLDHARWNGPQCEWNVEKGLRCPEIKVEADHAQPFSKGGLTEPENLLALCIVHHYGKHLLDEEPYSARLIMERMKPLEKAKALDLKKLLGF